MTKDRSDRTPSGRLFVLCRHGHLNEVRLMTEHGIRNYEYDEFCMFSLLFPDVGNLEYYKKSCHSCCINCIV